MADDEMKVWIQKQFAANLSTIATKEQVEGIKDMVAASSEGVRRNREDINEIRHAIERIEGRVVGTGV